MTKKNYVLVIAGASGAGKSTVADILISRGGYELSRSATTRNQRADKRDGEYLFVSEAEFVKMVSLGQMLEYTEYGGNLYGTPASEIDRIISSGKTPLLVLDLKGVKSLKTLATPYPVYAFYIYDELNRIEERLYSRDMTDGASVKNFLSFVKRKEQNIKDYLTIEEYAPYIDSFVKNTTPEECALEIKQRISASLSGEEIEEDKSGIASALVNMAKAKL